MVLGLFRRRSNPPAAGAKPIGPRGRMTPEGYIPTPEELEAAEPLPQAVEYWEPEEHGLKDEDWGWVLLAKNEWKPCMKNGVSGRALKNPVFVNGKSYEAMEWGPDGKIYLVDGITHALLAETYNCNKTAAEIAEKIMEETISELPKDNPWRQAVEAGKIEGQVKRELYGMYATFLKQLALLRSRGLIE